MLTYHSEMWKILVVFYLVVICVNMNAQSLSVTGRVELLFALDTFNGQYIYWTYTEKAILDDGRKFDLAACTDTHISFSLFCPKILDSIEYTMHKSRCIDKVINKYRRWTNIGQLIYRNSKHTFSNLKGDTLMISFCIRGKAFIITKETCPQYTIHEYANPINKPQKQFPVLLLNEIHKIKRLKKLEPKYYKFKNRNFVKGVM